ncbi:MAG: glycoside hydrolase family 1 protein, partial [Deltaproteobacteria bacterium]|nr:glycoside hydrolase family 1 protein [Deltaproteobacteria bacterium]
MTHPTNASSDPWKTLLPTEPIDFPPDFIWGVASSAFQAEGGEVNNDWVELAREGRVPPNPGNGFWEKAEEDFRLVADLGFGHYRLSIEWSRVEPEQGRFDDQAIDRYKAMCDSAREAGLTPWVNFFHFTHPAWFSKKGGFLDTTNHADFLRYIERMGKALAPHADHFHVANESMVYVLSAYLLGRLPPFISDQESAYDMTRNVLALHAEGYRILKGLDPMPTVAGIEVYLDPRPWDPANPEHRAA